MTVYQLHISGSDYDADGEDFDEYFSSLEAARRRRKQLIDADPKMKDCRFDSDYKIDKLTLSTKLSPRQLILAILNRKGYVKERETVVEEYQVKQTAPWSSP